MKKSNGFKILIGLLLILIVASAVLLGITILNEKQTESKPKQENYNNEEIEKPQVTQVVEVEEPKTFKGNDRPIAVMIDNHKSAMPQAGLNNAYLVYEIIVEGGETRLMALFKGTNLEKIGPVRSSRHYFLDYALENDAIYVHYGWSPQAQSDITKLGVNNINGISESTKSFWRTTDKYAPHNVATSTQKILEIAARKGYNITSNKKSVLNYVAKEVDLGGNIEATKVTIPYSDYNTVSYEYDGVTKRYTRYSRNTKQTDWTTGETVTTKNIIVVKCRNWTLNDGSNAGRQSIDNIKTLEGYYITNGKAIQITAEKNSRSGQTVYRDLLGNEIDVNDGNTFIQICPIDSKVKIEPGVPEQTTATIGNTINN